MESKIQPQLFNAIKNKTKKYEGMIYDEAKRRLRIGDIIGFVNSDNDEIIYVKITELHTYNTFLEAFNEISYKDTIPGEKSVNDVVNIYRNADDNIVCEQKYGVIFMGFDLIE